MHTQTPHKITILSVEDDSQDAYLLQGAFDLEQVSNPLQTVGDGEQAIAYLVGEGRFADRAMHPLPGLLLLDMKMPKVNGLEVLKWVRNHREFEALPVAFLTDSFTTEDVALAYHLGANAFIVKPRSFDELRGIVRFLKGWVQHTIVPPTGEKDWIALTFEDLEDRWPQLFSRAA